jgi:hypothetical protein
MDHLTQKRFPQHILMIIKGLPDYVAVHLEIQTIETKPRTLLVRRMAFPKRETKKLRLVLPSVNSITYPKGLNLM